MNPSTQLSSCAAVAVLISSSLAQTQLVLPAEYERAWGRGSSVMLGYNESRTQVIYAAPFAPGTVITHFAIRPTAATVDNASFTAVVEIRMSSTAAAPGALSSTFANNVGSDEAVVLAQQTVTVPAMPANRGTGAWADFALDAPFVFGTNGNPNICVDFTVYSRSAGAVWSTDRVFATANGRAATHGSANCGVGAPTSSSTGGSGAYTDGSTITIGATGMPANHIAVLALGVDQMEWAPGLQLPFDLSWIGAATGCELLVSPNVDILGTLTNGAGAASIAFTITGYSQFGFGAQYGYLIPPTAANPMGLEMIENRAIWVGPEVAVPVGHYVYDFGTGSSASNTGTASTDAAPIVRFTVL